MRTLQIDARAKVNITRLINYATDNKLDFNIIQKIASNQLPPAGDNPLYSCELNDGFRIVFTIEQQPDKNWYRHISISVNDRNKLPHPAAVELILSEFKFIGSIKDCHCWIEKTIPTAINLIQKL